jgi:NAD(P)-dependent dehydrogenase (short-subunit alcohol dehydrogenase family)
VLRLRLFHRNPRIRQLHHEQTRQAENIRRERTTHCAPRTGDLATAIEGSKALLDYSMTKGGIHAFTKSLSAQLIDRGIRVDAVAPGPVWTPLNPADRPPEEMTKFGAGTAMGRAAQPEEIAPAFVFMAAPSCSSYITGEILPTVGGYG